MTYTITGNELIYVNGVDGAGRPSPGNIPLPMSQVAATTLPAQYGTNTATSATTLTAANVAGANTAAAPTEIYLNMTGTLGAGANAQLPTVTALLGQIPNAVNNQTYTIRIINTSSGAFSWTVTTNTGWTLNGTSFAIAQNTWREFIVTITSVGSATATLQSIGTGTYS